MGKEIQYVEISASWVWIAAIMLDSSKEGSVFDLDVTIIDLLWIKMMSDYII